MEKAKQKLGVTFIHLKDKWAYGSTTDSRMSKFEFDDIQIHALKSFLEDGAFEVMFTFVDYNHYNSILNLNYMSLANETTSSNRIIELESEFKEKENELKVAYKMHTKAQNENQPQ